MRFLIDENIHEGVVSFLKGLGQSPAHAPKGISNKEFLNFGISKGRTLVTHDKGFVKDQIIRQHPGIILVWAAPGKFEEWKASFRNLLSKKRSPDLFRGKLFLVESDGWREFPFVFKETRLASGVVVRSLG